ncbi:MAG: C40 family peptidase [Neisseria sp.]|uniref:C40 family peptidase n=1 Tax=Neisseria sp. TaxID=192066 RepID=UPI0026DCA550|nr:C40 family peptidase [Neisseria sp.]MDO4642101.1 C40 family peptidase [Neisseria sp.]
MSFLKQLCSGLLAAVAMLSVPLSKADDLEQFIRFQSDSLNVNQSMSTGQVVGRNEADQLIGSAMSLLGVAYRFGGTRVSTGFDCSGFMQYIFNKSMQVSLPRTAAEQSRAGIQVSRSELQPGDMVFFSTSGHRVSHVGLYIGNDRFIHAPRTGKTIEITSLSNKYWSARYVTARRVKRNDPARFLN